MEQYHPVIQIIDTFIYIYVYVRAFYSNISNLLKYRKLNVLSIQWLRTVFIESTSGKFQDPNPKTSKYRKFIVDRSSNSLEIHVSIPPTVPQLEHSPCRPTFSQSLFAILISGQGLPRGILLKAIRSRAAAHIPYT